MTTTSTELVHSFDLGDGLHIRIEATESTHLVRLIAIYYPIAAESPMKVFDRLVGPNTARGIATAIEESADLSEWFPRRPGP